MTIDREAFEKELAAVEATAQAIRRLAPWRFLRAWELIGDVRDGLRRAMTLARHQGSFWLDIRTWLPSIMLSLFPFDFIAKAIMLFGVLTASIHEAMTRTTEQTVREQVVVTVPRERTRFEQVRSWVFWTREVPIVEKFTDQVTEERDVIVKVDHPPPKWLPPLVAGSIILVTTLSFSWAVMRFWAWRAVKWASWLRRRVIEATESGETGMADGDRLQLL